MISEVWAVLSLILNSSISSSKALSYAEVTKKSLKLQIFDEKVEKPNLIKEKVENVEKDDVKNENFNKIWTED